jgi:formate-dependent phosphoribosylglycinamide formyltransferase (GAR transformylase)
MPNVVFVAPFAMASTVRFVRAAASLFGVRLGVISQEPPERLPIDLRQQLHGFSQTDDALGVDSLLEAVKSIERQLGSVDSLISVLEPLQVPLAMVRERLRIRGMDAATAHNFRDKATMKEVFAAHDLPCARHRLCSDATQAFAFARSAGYPLVGKPPAGAGAKTTAKLANDSELQAFLVSTKPAVGQEVLLEEFVQGREFSFDSITLHGAEIFHNISDYHPTPLLVLENQWIQWGVVLPRHIDGPPYAKIREVGPRALQALGMWTGMSHMEWFQRPDGSIAIGEVGARPPGAQFMTLMSYAHDCDMYRLWAQLMIYEQVTPPVRSHAAGAAYLRGQGTGRVKAVHGLDQVQALIGAVVVESKLPQIGQPQAESYEGEGYVIVRHQDTSVVEAALQTIVSNLRVELG